MSLSIKFRKDVGTLRDASNAKEKLGWEPKISFKQLVEDMCIYGQ